MEFCLSINFSRLVKNKQAVVMTFRRRISEIPSLGSHLVLSHVISLGKKRSAVVRK